MNVKIYGEGANRIGVRPITPKIFWICHCIGNKARELNRGFAEDFARINPEFDPCLLYTSPSPRDKRQSRMPSSA